MCRGLFSATSINGEFNYHNSVKWVVLFDFVLRYWELNLGPHVLVRQMLDHWVITSVLVFTFIWMLSCLF